MRTNETDTDTTDEDESTVRADGGAVGSTATRHEQIDYLDREVNLLRPSTPFMRDHLKVVWSGFVVWALVVFGPVTLTAIAPGVMTGTQMFGFPLHYLLVSLGAPLGALVLSAVYAYSRDRLDEKYDIDHAEPVTADEGAGDDAAVTDGGETG